MDAKQLRITQNELDNHLFHLLSKYGYGVEVFNRYRMMHNFFRERIPLVIILAGTGCLGKRQIATNLSQQLNLPNALHSNLVTQVMSRFSLFLSFLIFPFFV